MPIGMVTSMSMNLDMLSGYCAGWSLKMLLREGFNGVPDKVESAPPKHLSSAVGQMVNFLGTLQNEWAGLRPFRHLTPISRLISAWIIFLMKSSSKAFRNLSTIECAVPLGKRRRLLRT